jgi:ATP-dependent RNA helicase RhlE
MDHPHPKQPAHAQKRPAHPAASGFASLPLLEPLHRALAKEGYTVPTPIQAQSIPPLLAGRDLFGAAQTGTGKTAAFLLPLLQHLVTHKRMPSRGRPRSLILAPTRELAAQIGESVVAYGRFVHVTHTVIYGGVGQRPQVDALMRGMDIVVATPGRLLDLMQQRFVRLDGIEVFVLDEADRMLDMGFIRDIRKIIAALPAQRQSLFFSATLSQDVLALARTMVRDPVHVAIEPEKPTVERIVQKVLFVDRKDKDELLAQLLHGIDKVIVFTQMKHVANKVAHKLAKAGVSAVAIHGNKSQAARTQALEGFRSGKVRALVATDIAARGIDVEGITHVVNYDMPIESETYVHRIGRTARAGADGDAISFCSPDERDSLRAIERLIHMQIPVDTQHSFHSEQARNATGSMARPAPKQQRGHLGRRPAGHARGGHPSYARGGRRHARR